MSRIMKVLGQLLVPMEDMMRGTGWGDDPPIDFTDARREAWGKLALFTGELETGQYSEEQRFNFIKSYAVDLWCVIFHLAAKCENKDYRPHKSGTFNCQSAVFYLDTVVVNFAEMIEATKNTADKLTKDGDATRAERLKGLSEILDNLKTNIANIRQYTNSGKSGL